MYAQKISKVKENKDLVISESIQKF